MPVPATTWLRSHYGSNAPEALERFAVTPVDLVLLDYVMPDVNGGHVAAMMKRIKPDVRILMFSGVEHVPGSAQVHVNAFLQKGQMPSIVLDKIRELQDSAERPKVQASP